METNSHPALTIAGLTNPQSTAARLNALTSTLVIGWVCCIILVLPSEKPQDFLHTTTGIKTSNFDNMLILIAIPLSIAAYLFVIKSKFWHPYGRLTADGFEHLQAKGYQYERIAPDRCTFFRLTQPANIRTVQDNGYSGLEAIINKNDCQTFYVTPQLEFLLNSMQVTISTPYGCSYA